MRERLSRIVLHGMRSTRIRALAEKDLDAARELLRGAVPTESLLEALSSALESAARSPGDEQRGVGIEVDDSLAGILVYGEYAGAVGAGRLHLVAVDRSRRRQGLGSLLLDHAICRLAERGARFALAEFPLERPALDDYAAFLHARDFSEESRIEDFHRAGVPLVFLRRELLP